MSQHDHIDQLLMTHGVKPTANRIVVAKTLEKADKPLSLSQLEMTILSIDKSGIFRALTLFRQNGLVHVIDDAEGAKYELCRSHHHSHDDDTHVHFHCEKCHDTICLSDIPVPDVTLPEGFSPLTASYVIKGVCPKCQNLL